MNLRLSPRRARFIALATSVAALGALVVAVPQSAVGGPSVVSQTFTYTGSLATFTVPSGISALTVTVTGGQGGNGGSDATPAPPAGGYRGVVTGTIAVTPNQVLTIGVGNGGATGASRVSASTARAAGGASPIAGEFAGGAGGQAGANGSSGAGGAGGAASVIKVGDDVVVAGGGGGNGGSGQFAPTQGRTATATYAGRSDSTSTVGQKGINANDACLQTSCSNNDGGGSGGGGGGAQGGAAGQIEFGAGTSNEWYGFGGSVGQNSTASLSGLSSSYEYYSTNGGAGSVVISYTTGPPAAPTEVRGTAGNGAVKVFWVAPVDSGQSIISNYLAQYSTDGGATWSTAVDLGTAENSATVSGLSNGTAYRFRVAAVNSAGTGSYSDPSAAVTPLSPPTAPTITTVTAQDGALKLALTPPSSGAPVTGYDYRVDDGSWVSVASPSTSITIPGLINGTTYSVEVRASSAVGAGETSEPADGTPLAVPGAPTISSLAIADGALSVAFTPGFSGGGPITSYEYQLDEGSWVTASGTSSPIVISGLEEGTAYSVALRAVNSVGAGASSEPAAATTPALPGAPIIDAVTAGDSSAQVSFAPSSTGGSPIEEYEYQVNSSGGWVSVPGSSSPLLITGLTNGESYDVRIRAINAVGTGSASEAAAVTPATVPSAPAIVGDTVAGSDATLTAAFTAPSSNGGSAITTYEYSTDAGATWRTRTDGGITASPVIIETLSSDGSTPLSNGVTYYVELRAVNAIGAGTASAVASGIAQTSPSAPLVTKVAASNGALAVSFTAGSNGGAAITSYEYSINEGSDWVSTGTLGTSFVISGLSNGTSYPVQVRAVNSVGAGESSAAVAGKPVGLPGQAAIGGVVRSNQTLTASVSLTDNGGSPVTAWQYSTDAGATWSTASGTSSPLTLTTISSDGATRLANGTGYALQVRAVTAVGTGPASPTTIVAPASAPAAPSIAVTAGNTVVGVVFALGTDGGSPVTQLEYSLDAGDNWVSAGTLSSPVTISGLTNGTEYNIQLRAVNAIGNGTPSVTAQATPRTIPGSPRTVVAVSNSASADVTWAAPAFNGGAPITGYTVSAYTSNTSTTPVSSCTTTGATLCSIAGLTNGTQYYVEVTATNAAGTGAESTPRVLVTPLARPAAPTLNTLTAGDGTISAAFSAGSAGDRAISGYQYSVDGGTSWTSVSSTSSPILISGLTNGTTYTVAVRAVSAAGVGASSNTKQSTPFTYPSAPETSTIIANGGNGQIAVSWDAANLNGGSLLNYTATAFTGLTSGSTSATCTTTGLSCVITGLTNGTTYYVSLQTQNTANMYSVRSAPRVPATPSLAPGVSTSVTATAGDASATVVWDAPMSTGASAITSYDVWCSVDGGSYAKCATTSSTSATLLELTNGASYAFTVYANNSNGTGPVSAASNSVTPLAAGAAPTFSGVTSTGTGFTATIANYDATASYSATATNGANVTVSGSGITVTGLSNGESSRVTVTVKKSTSTDATASFDGASLLSGVKPTFSDYVATAVGFTFSISNYDADSTYTLTVDNGATVTRTGADVTVTGLTIGDSASVTAVVDKSGASQASAINRGAAMVSGTAPTFSDLVSTRTGYEVTIANYDSTLEYTVGATGGATVTRSGATVTVTGLVDGASADLTITATEPGVSIAAATTTGAALHTGTVPVLNTPTRTNDGFTFTVKNFDARNTYVLSSTSGSVSMSGATVTVAGLKPGIAATVTVVAERDGYTTHDATQRGVSINAGVAPTLSSAVAINGGFVFTITNYSSAFTYVLSTSEGTISRTGNQVTVSGLTPGATAIAQLTATQSGYQVASARISGAAVVPAPVFEESSSGAETKAPTGSSGAVVSTEDKSTAPSAPTMLAPLRESQAGKAAVTSGGSTVSSTLSSTGNTVKLSSSNGLVLRVAAKQDGEIMPLAADGVVEVKRSGELWVTVSGLSPQSTMQYWSLGNKSELAQSRADASGTTATGVMLPGTLSAGEHTLVVTGVDSAGEPVTMQIGIRVLDAENASSTTSLMSSWWVGWSAAGVLLLLLSLFFWFVLARRRRREEEEEVA